MPSISHYEILEKLGEGGMGVVWKARDTRLQRLVALKLLPAEKTADEARRQRFVQEARAASALNHPNIVAIYEIDRAEGADFIAMEYVAGKTLDLLIPKKGLRVGEALKYAIQIAGGLAAAHAEGIVHRDLKPGNVVVSEKGAVKLLDFGLAKLVEERGLSESEGTRTINVDAPRTEEGTILGTVSYMSPEQAEGRKVDARSDIFAFGSLLYEMLTGRRAFQGDSRMATLAAILRSEPEPLEKLAEGIPRELGRLVQRCLRKEPDRRAHSMQDLKLALEELKEDSDSGVSGVTAPAAAARPRIRMFVAVASGIMVLAAAATAFWYRELLAPVTPLKAIPLTTFAGIETGPTLSPDGNQVAFTWTGEKSDNWDIYVQVIGSGKPVRITTDSGVDLNPAWSPDGRTIAFLRASAASRELELMVIPALGGAERELAHWESQQGDTANQIAWSVDGHSIVYAAREPGKGSALFAVSTDSGEIHRITEHAKGTNILTQVSASPDGRSLAYFRANTSGSRAGELLVIPIDGNLRPQGEARKLASEPMGVSGIAWTGDSREVVYASFSSGPGLRRVAASGRQPSRAMEVGEGALGALAISGRANRLVYGKVLLADVNVWRINLTDPAASPEPVLNSTRTEVEAQYSPDGKKIAFKSDRSGAFQIWVSESNGSNGVQLTNGGEAGSPRWSPDGREIAFNGLAQGHWEIFVIPSGGGQPRQLTSTGRAVRPSWSRDGRWVYFAGPAAIWKVSAAGGTPVQFGTLRRGNNVLESADGSAIYYHSGGQMFTASVDGQGERKLTDGLESLEVVREGFYYTAGAPERGIRFFNFATGTSRQILKVEKGLNLGLSVSPDGKWLLYSQIDTLPVSDLMVVENFK